MTKILIVYDSRLGSVARMARLIARGVASIEDCEAVVRQAGSTNDDAQEFKDVEATLDDLAECDGLILGSPTRFGNMSHRLKRYIDSASSIWMSSALEGKPAAVFTSSSSMHGGQESTLLSMHVPLLHLGMLIVGLPFSHTALKHTQSGGTPYGASHVAGASNTNEISEDERALCKALGMRVASVAKRLN